MGGGGGGIGPRPELIKSSSNDLSDGHGIMNP